MPRRLRLIPVLLLTLAGCRSPAGHPPASAPERMRLRLKLQPLGQQTALEELLETFERDHPEVEISVELLPNASDVAHQFFLTALEGGSRDFDLLVIDTIWVSEFARAGWIADISEAFPPDAIRRDFLPGAAEVVVVDGRTYAVPWYVDVGLLYYRADLVPRAPRTYEELARFTRDAMREHPGLQGYVWQGRQYEGLVCNAYEAIWGHGGRTMQGRRVLLDTPQARAALAYLRSLIVRGLSPPSVTSAAEEQSRQVFQAGHAVFMRNWPYAFAEASREGSPLRGKLGIAPLPTLSGEPGSGALGGWQLALNAHAPEGHRRAALQLLAHLTSPEANIQMAIAYGRNPPRRSLYEDPELIQRVPFLSLLAPIVERARPRPVTPYYPLLSDDLQGEFSAAISGIRSPEEALARAQHRVDQLTGTGP